MNNRERGFGAVCRQVMRVALVGASLAACAPAGAIEGAPASAPAAVTTPETATVLRDGLAVQVRVQASAPDASGQRLWWVTGEGVAIHAQALTLAAALAKGAEDVEGGPGPSAGNGTMSLGGKSLSGDDGEPWTLANMGIGGGR